MSTYLAETEAGTDPIEMVRYSMEDVTEPRELTFVATFCFVQMWRLAAGYYGLDQNDPEILALTKRIDAIRT